MGRRPPPVHARLTLRVVSDERQITKESAFAGVRHPIGHLAAESLTAGETISALTSGAARSDAAARRVSPAVTQMRQSTRALRAEASTRFKQRDVRMEARRSSPPRALIGSAPSPLMTVAGRNGPTRSGHHALLARTSGGDAASSLEWEVPRDPQESVDRIPVRAPVRSSAAECLTFVAASGMGGAKGLGGRERLAQPEDDGAALRRRSPRRRRSGRESHEARRRGLWTVPRLLENVTNPRGHALAAGRSHHARVAHVHHRRLENAPRRYAFSTPTTGPTTTNKISSEIQPQKRVAPLVRQMGPARSRRKRHQR